MSKGLRSLPSQSRVLQPWPSSHTVAMCSKATQDPDRGQPPFRLDTSPSSPCRAPTNRLSPDTHCDPLGLRLCSDYVFLKCSERLENTIFLPPPPIQTHKTSSLGR